jgi:transcriptional regulator with XRE-family HTH domain
MPNYQTFGERLSFLIRLTDNTQRELANFIGVDDGLISLYANGKVVPSANRVTEICNALNLTNDQIVYLIVGSRNQI